MVNIFVHMLPCWIYNDHMTNDNQTFQMCDWNKLAREALDLWEGHLSAISSDPKAKEEMAKFIAPMSHMFTQWSDMMQGGLHSTTSAQEAEASASGEPDVAAAQDQATQEPAVGASSASAADTVSVQFDDPYAKWHADMIKAAQAAAEASLATYIEAPQTPVEQTRTAAVVETASEDVCEAETPTYAARGMGATFAAMQDILSDLDTSQDTPDAEADRAAVVDATPMATVAKPDLAASAVSSDSGRAPAAAGPRDLAELASRLAQLERELDGLRGTGKEGHSASAFDDADDADALRMARARQG